MKVKILTPFVTYNGPVPIAPKPGAVVDIPAPKAKALLKAGYVEEHVEPAPDPVPVTPASEPAKPATSRATKATGKAPENKAPESKTPEPAEPGAGD